MVMVWILAHNNDSFMSSNTTIFRIISGDSFCSSVSATKFKKTFYRYYDYYVVCLLKILIGIIHTKARQ